MDTHTGSSFARARAVWLAAILATSWACASTGGVPRPFPTPSDGPAEESAPVADVGLPGSVAARSAASRLDADALVGTALDLQGIRYRHGGSDPQGFDCSGFTQYVFAQHAVPLPREVRDQFRVGRPVHRDELRPGDLLFFSTTTSGASHVAIALGGNEFVHAPSSTGVVRTERLTSSYWSRRFLGAKRVG
jgi:cell wall-associated NlpC family hydrolase